MDTPLHPLIRLARTVAAHQLHLQMVQRVDVGKAVANRALQRCVIGQAILVTGDGGQGMRRAVPFGLYGRENLFAQTGVCHQIRVARCQRQTEGFMTSIARITVAAIAIPGFSYISKRTG